MHIVVFYSTAQHSGDLFLPFSSRTFHSITTFQPFQSQEEGHVVLGSPHLPWNNGRYMWRVMIHGTRWLIYGMNGLAAHKPATGKSSEGNDKAQSRKC